jgi:hypothetical protein
MLWRGALMWRQMTNEEISMNRSYLLLLHLVCLLMKVCEWNSILVMESSAYCFTKLCSIEQ